MYVSSLELGPTITSESNRILATDLFVLNTFGEDSVFRVSIRIEISLDRKPWTPLTTK